MIDRYAGNHSGLGLAGSRSVFAEPREKEPFWFRCGCTVPLPRTTEAQAFSPVGFQVEKENLFRPKALKGVRWPEVVSVAAFLSNLVGQALPHSLLTHAGQREEAPSKFHGMEVEEQRGVGVSGSVSRDKQGNEVEHLLRPKSKLSPGIRRH